MKDRKNQPTTNHEINLQADTLADLPVAGEQAIKTKGGTTGGHVKVFDGTRLSNSPDQFDDIIVGTGSGAINGHVK